MNRPEDARLRLSKDDERGKRVIITISYYYTNEDWDFSLVRQSVKRGTETGPWSTSTPSCNQSQVITFNWLLVSSRPVPGSRVPD